MVSIPRARAMSHTAFTGVIWPVMLIMWEMRISRVRSVIPFSNAAVISFEVLRRNRNLNELELEVFPLLTLTQRGEHARVILSGGENFVAGFEVHAHEQSLERFRSVARDRDFFTVAAEQLGQAGANGFRLRLEDLPHRVSGRVFLFPDVTNQRLSHDARTGRHAAVIQIDDAARDAERVLNGGPVIFVSCRFFRRETRNGLRRCFDIVQ